ncbi:MAG: phosphate acyltransferase PlsX [Planctomycetota bacterium]|nr:phosphate acyltransferase PlsX [Planctomycetota bacterium]
MRIGLDVMGGDHAPQAIVEGAVTSVEFLSEDDELVLVGEQALVEDGVLQIKAAGGNASSIITTQVIGMDESPAKAVRGKPDSSIVVLARAASKKADRRLDVILSAGNTGAKVAAAQMFMKRLPNVHRPGIAVTLPTFSGPVIIIDVGANIEPKPSHLAQYGIMGDVYARKIHGIEKPRIGLMNVGGEEAKGTADMKRARDMLRDAEGVDFIGYVEGRGVFDGEADVVITDGVVGNVMVKLAEGLAMGIFKAIAQEISQVDASLAAQFNPIIKRIYSRHDYHDYGGAPLLGVNGVCLICHGSSQARTIANGIRAAREFVQSGVNDAIVEQLGAMEEVSV